MPAEKPESARSAMRSTSRSGSLIIPSTTKSEEHPELDFQGPTNWPAEPVSISARSSGRGLRWRPAAPGPSQPEYPAPGRRDCSAWPCSCHQGNGDFVHMRRGREFGEQVAHQPDLLQPVGRPFRPVRDFHNGNVRLDLLVLRAGSFLAQLRNLVVRPQPAHQAALFFRRALVIEGHEAKQQFFLGLLLVRRLVH